MTIARSSRFPGVSDAIGVQPRDLSFRGALDPQEAAAASAFSHAGRHPAYSVATGLSPGPFAIGVGIDLRRSQGRDRKRPPCPLTP